MRKLARNRSRSASSGQLRPGRQQRGAGGGAAGDRGEWPTQGGEWENCNGADASEVDAVSKPLPNSASLDTFGCTAWRSPAPGQLKAPARADAMVRHIRAPWLKSLLLPPCTHAMTSGAAQSLQIAPPAGGLGVASLASAERRRSLETCSRTQTAAYDQQKSPVHVRRWLPLLAACRLPAALPAARSAGVSDVV